MFDIRLLEALYNTIYVAHVVSNTNLEFSGNGLQWLSQQIKTNKQKKTKEKPPNPHNNKKKKQPNPHSKKTKTASKTDSGKYTYFWHWRGGKMGVPSKEIQATSHKCCIKSTWCFMKAYFWYFVAPFYPGRLHSTAVPYLLGKPVLQLQHFSQHFDTSNSSFFPCKLFFSMIFYISHHLAIQQ